MLRLEYVKTQYLDPPHTLLRLKDKLIFRQDATQAQCERHHLMTHLRATPVQGALVPPFDPHANVKDQLVTQLRVTPVLGL